MSEMVAPFELGLCVSDLDQMVQFYEAVLGCREMARAALPGERTTVIGLAAGDVDIVWLQTTWGERIKLLRPATAPAAAPAPPAVANLTATRGVAYLTFCVDDLDEPVARAKALGATALTDEIVSDSGRGTRIVFFRDPEGTVIELVEREDLAAYRPDLFE